MRWNRIDSDGRFRELKPDEYIRFIGEIIDNRNHFFGISLTCAEMKGFLNLTVDQRRGHNIDLDERREAAALSFSGILSNPVVFVRLDLGKAYVGGPNGV